MDSKKLFLFIFSIFLMVPFVLCEEIIARYQGGEISLSELEEVAAVIPRHIQQEYILDDFSRFAEIYAVGNSLTQQEQEFVLKNEQTAHFLELQKESMLSRILYTREIADKIEVDENKMREYYEQNKKREFYTPQQYTIKHIYISTYKYPPKEYTVQEGDTLETISKNFHDNTHYAAVIKELNNLKPSTALTPGMTLKIPYTWSEERVPEEDEDIIESRREWAKYIRSLALRPGTDFTQLAMEFSQTDREEKGSVIGPIPDARAPKPVLPEIIETLENMQPGEISPVIQTKHGFEIIKLIEIIPEKIRSYEEVKDQIQARKQRQIQEELVNNYLDKIKNAPYVETYFDVLEQDNINTDSILMKVGSYTKTYQDLLNSINQNPALTDILSQPEQLNMYLESVLIQKAIIEQAYQDKLHQTPEFIRGYSAFKAILLADQYLDMKARDMVEELEISDETLIEYYKENERNFYRPARYNLNQISRKINDSEEEHRAIMQEVYEKLVQGADFEELAKEYSTDAYARRGGKVGFIREDSRDAKYIEVVSSLEPEDFSEPFEIQNALYIIQLLEKSEAYTQSFEEVKPQVNSMYRSFHYREKRQSLLKDMLEKIDYKPLS